MRKPAGIAQNEVQSDGKEDLVFQPHQSPSCL
jgi:hypothetical protein